MIRFSGPLDKLMDETKERQAACPHSSGLTIGLGGVICKGCGKVQIPYAENTPSKATGPYYNEVVTWPK